MSLLLAIIVLVNSYALHPERGDSPDNPAVFRQVVFREYAQSKGT